MSCMMFDKTGNKIRVDYSIKIMKIRDTSLWCSDGDVDLEEVKGLGQPRRGWHARPGFLLCNNAGVKQGSYPAAPNLCACRSNALSG